MSFATYGDLKTSLASWSGRSDLTTPIADFVSLAHKQIMRDLRGHLRLQKSDRAFSIATQYVAVPTDFLELVSLQIQTSPVTTVQFLPNDTAATAYLSTGCPKFVSLTGATTPGTEVFRFSPAPDQTYTAHLEYYSTITFFANDAAANWILTDHPYLYLYGSLVHLFAYIKDIESAAGAQQMYANELALIKKAGNRARWGANGMTVRAG